MAGYDGRGARFDVVAVEGADLSFTVTAVDTAGDPVDLSAATISASVFNLAGAVVGTLTTGVSGAGSNVVTVSLVGDDALLMEGGGALLDEDGSPLITEGSTLSGAPYSWSLKVTRGGDDRVWLAGSFQRTAASSARLASTGTAVTATVDTNVTVTAAVLTSVGGVTALPGLSDVTITTPVDGQALTYNGTAWVNSTPAGSGDMLAANNLSDVDNAATARTNLGLGTAATAAAGDFATGAEGDLATSAVQPDDLADVATSGAYSDLSGAPSIPVVDATSVAAAGAVMDSEVANLAAVKAFDPANYATAAQGTKADNAVPKKAATTQTGTTYTVDADDDDSTVILSNAAAVAVTIPTGLTVGYKVLLASVGAGGLSLTTTGNTLLGSSPSVGVAQNEAIYVEVTASNTLLVLGGPA